MKLAANFRWSGCLEKRKTNGNYRPVQATTVITTIFFNNDLKLKMYEYKSADTTSLFVMKINMQIANYFVIRVPETLNYTKKVSQFLALCYFLDRSLMCFTLVNLENIRF